MPTQVQSVDELLEEFMRTGDPAVIDEGVFDFFKSGASKAVGFAKRVAGAASGGSRTRQRRIGGSVEMMPGPKLLGPGREPALLTGQIGTSKHGADAYANSRLLPSVSIKTGEKDHPITSSLHSHDYAPVGEYKHPEGGHFSVWMQHERDRRGNLRDYPSEDGGQFHVEHDTNTGHATGNWHYFHPPDQHTSNAGRWNKENAHNADRFHNDPSDHGSLEHPENVSDFDNHQAAEMHGKYSKGEVGHHLSRFIDDMDELKPSNAHHGGRYASEEEGDLRRHGWSHSHDDNHASHEDYEFASNPASVYTHDDPERAPHLEDHEIHLHANGGWSHMHPEHGKIASHHDGADLRWHLKYGIKDILGASVHDKRDEENDFPDHVKPQHNMGSGSKGYDGEGDDDEE